MAMTRVLESIPHYTAIEDADQAIGAETRRRCPGMQSQIESSEKVPFQLLFPGKKARLVGGTGIHVTLAQVRI